MTEIIQPGAGLLYMKVGTHAQESLEDIIQRKSREIEDTGFGMWGYGGTTCHPTSMVQPFAQKFAKPGQPIYLVMEEMDSKHFADPICAAEYSIDGRTWDKIPDSIEVRGSRYALIIKALRRDRLSLPLEKTRIPVGPSRGRVGDRYVAGRVDKACLEVLESRKAHVDQPPKVERSISLVAELKHPYAVFLRNRR